MDKKQEAERALAQARAAQTAAQQKADAERRLAQGGTNPVLEAAKQKEAEATQKVGDALQNLARANGQDV